VRGVTGAAHLRALDGPFVAALNHSQRPEAFLVPALLAWLRGGRILRFLADWPFMLLPPVYVLYRSAQVIPVATKPARPRLLTPLRRLVAPAPHGLALARRCLAEGQPVGFFVEGTVNRHPTELLRGRRGAARLALAHGVPVLPVGLRFPDHADPARPIGDAEPLAVHVGAPLAPPAAAVPPPGAAPAADAVRAHHARIMTALARLSGTTWRPDRVRPAPPAA
jgi:1-acyl-sn-glycerol-3-phosphate acyltransferase